MCAFGHQCVSVRYFFPNIEIFTPRLAFPPNGFDGEDGGGFDAPK